MNTTPGESHPRSLFSMLHGRSSFHLNTPTAADPAAAGGADPAAADPNAPPEMIPKSEAQKAFAARDQAKRVAALLARNLNLDPASLKLVETGDPADPYKLDSPALDQLSNAVKGIHNAQVEQQSARLTAYEKFIDSRMVDTELRTALAAQGAIDPLGTGEYADAIALLRSKIKVDRTIGEDGQLSVSIAALDAKGQPMPDAGAAAVVEEFLKARPALKRATARPGPGAGGYGDRGNRRGPQGKPILNAAERGDAAGDVMFGSRPIPGARPFFNGNIPGGNPRRLNGRTSG